MDLDTFFVTEEVYVKNNYRFCITRTLAHNSFCLTISEFHSELIVDILTIFRGTMKSIRDELYRQYWLLCGPNVEN